MQLLHIKKINTNLPVIYVDNTKKSLQKLAFWHREKFTELKIIAITGSNGKTTSKNMMGYILSQKGSTLITEKNYNNDIGVPLTLFNINQKHKYMVVEIGANHLNEILPLAKLVKANVSVVSTISEAHIGKFGNLENIIKTKGQIYTTLKSGDIAVIDFNSPHKKYWLSVIKSNVKVVYFNNSNTYISNINRHKDNIIFILHHNKNNIKIFLQTIGIHNIHNALLSATCALTLGASLSNIKKGLEFFRPANGRLSLTNYDNYLIINDCYNANPLSMCEALNSLATYKITKIAILGDMLELGTISLKKHQEIGNYIKKLPIDYLYTFGNFAKHYDGVLFNNIDDICNCIIKKHNKPCVILLKASRKIQLERIIKWFDNYYSKK